MHEYDPIQSVPMTFAVPGAELSPDQTPQVVRELTILKGALDGVRRAAQEIVEKTKPVQRQQPENDSSAKLTEAFPVTAPLAEELRNLSNECGYIESMLAQASHRIEL